MMTFITRRPWIWIVLAFVILITGWVFLLQLAAKHRPEAVEIQTIQQSNELP